MFTSNWSTGQTAEFQEAVTIAGLALTFVAAALVGWGILRSRRSASGQIAASVNDAIELDARPSAAAPR